MNQVQPLPPAFDVRNEYGYPLALSYETRLARAKQYADESRQRNKTPCNCDTCRREALLPAVQNITENWRTK